MNTVRGMSLIDVIVGTAIILLVFLSLFGILQASLRVSMFVKSESTALAIANNQIEYIRSLPYNSVGTISGIPSGTIPQNATTTEDGVSYGVRTFIEYYDDPADGLGSNDINGITTDYKKIKVVVTYYTTANQQRQVVLNSIDIPPGVETTTNGGTLEIIVVNATGAPLSGATVQITNASTSPAVNLTTFTDTSGIVDLPGAQTSTQYAITVSKAGYSTAQTYARDATNQNPTPGYLTVVQGQTTSSTFAIDVLGQIKMQTFSPITSGSFSDTFTDTSKLSAQTNTTASGNTLTLSDTSGSYASTGTATSISINPAYLYSWGSVSVSPSTPSGTSEVVQVLDGSGNLIPDTVLPGNSTGFSSSSISLSGVSTTTYPALELKATLATNSGSATPQLSSWGVSYTYGPVPLPNVAFTLTGAKTIGTTGSGLPIYKTVVSTTTGSTAVNSITLEWDSYKLAVSKYDIEDACEAPPYSLSPGTSLTESLILGPQTTNSLLVTVTNSATGAVVPGATVTLTNGSYSSTATSSSCGGAYFGSLSASSNYSVSISATGYTSNTANNITVSGQSFYGASF